jgi:hypothetical protein
MEWGPSGLCLIGAWEYWHVAQTGFDSPGERRIKSILEI